MLTRYIVYLLNVAKLVSGKMSFSNHFSADLSRSLWIKQFAQVHIISEVLCRVDVTVKRKQHCTLLPVLSRFVRQYISHVTYFGLNLVCNLLVDFMLEMNCTFATEGMLGMKPR